MNVGGIHDVFSSITAGTDRTYTVRTDREFNLTLKLGEVLKGKVLRHYEGGRYSVNFGGQERVVDSQFPLRVGDTIQGRVVAIDDKVHLQRIVDSAIGDTRTDDVPVNLRDEIALLFSRYQVPLTQAQHLALTKLARRLGGSTQVALGALILHKLGLPPAPELIEAVYRVLIAPQSNVLSNTGAGVQLPTGQMDGAVNPIVVQELAALLAQLSDDVRERAAALAIGVGVDGDAQDSPDQHRHEWYLGQWLLNAQGDGSLAHRYLRFPIWLDDRMIEVNMALYSQHERQAESSELTRLRHQKIVFSLQGENLGRIEIEAVVADRHIRLAVNVEHQYAAERLAEYLTTLTSALDERDWQLDEIRYSIHDDLKGVMQSVVEHHVTPESLSRLM